MIILDTNVISEFMRAKPDETVANWVQGYSLQALAITTITVAEIQRGLARLPQGQRQTQLSQRFEEILKRGFSERILSFDMRAASHYGELCLLREQRGLAIGSADMMIASCAKVANATVATRNTKDFEGVGLTLINPWQPS